MPTSRRRSWRRGGINVARSDEAVAVASARLAQVLSLNAAQPIRPIETAVTAIDLVFRDSAPQESLRNGSGQSARAKGKSRPGGRRL